MNNSWHLSSPKCCPREYPSVRSKYLLQSHHQLQQPGSKTSRLTAAHALPPCRIALDPSGQSPSRLLLYVYQALPNLLTTVMQGSLYLSILILQMLQCFIGFLHRAFGGRRIFSLIRLSGNARLRIIFRTPTRRAALSIATTLLMKLVLGPDDRGTAPVAKVPATHTFDCIAP